MNIISTNLTHPVTLVDREIKQVEFLRSVGVRGRRVYVYDGATYGQWRGYNPDSLRQNEAYGTTSQKKVWGMIEFKNAKDSGLGMPLPAGKANSTARQRWSPGIRRRGLDRPRAEG